MEESKNFEFAGFWLRFVAYIIDSIVMMFIIFPLAIIMSIISEILANSLISLLTSLLLNIFSIVFIMLYFAFMESSKFQATLGKMALDLKVVDLEGNKVSFLKALGRNLGKIISQLILWIGFIMAGFTEKKQALHDIMSNCLVIKK